MESCAGDTHGVQPENETTMKFGRAGGTAPYACDPAASRGRLFAEPQSPTRTEFERDRDRVIHATAFRRLKDKTQVFLYDEGDHYRTRLTHTLEVSQIARALARSLHLDEDLAEALALSHDLGHPPFGHAGERALDAAMAAYGGFDHNAQSLRVVTLLERRYPRFDGLNLTWETLEGLVKHNGPLTDRQGRPVGRYRDTGLPLAIAEYAARHDLWLWSHAAGEAQAAALADDIAYDAHDLDDGLRAGLVGLDDLVNTELLGGIVSAVRADHPSLAEDRTRAEVVRRMISAMIGDVVGESRSRIGALAPASADAIRQADRPTVAFSAAMAAADRAIKTRLATDVYQSTRVRAVMDEAEAIVGRLFDRYRNDASALPEPWRSPANEDDAGRARRIADFLAGMTDRYAIAEHKRLFDATPDLG
jgi:dGTPase